MLIMITLLKSFEIGTTLIIVLQNRSRMQSERTREETFQCSQTFSFTDTDTDKETDTDIKNTKMFYLDRWPCKDE